MSEDTGSPEVKQALVYSPNKAVVYCAWADVPHLSKEIQAQYLRDTPEYERNARSKGIPHLGSGRIYTTDPEQVKINEFSIPKHWRRMYSFDTGWNFNAVVWIAWDEESDVVYVTDIYRTQKERPEMIASVIRTRSRWKMPGVADAADVDRKDGIQTIETYRGMGLDLELPNKALQSGLREVWIRLDSGRLRVFNRCDDWFAEYRLYNRDTKGKIQEQDASGSLRHDLLDATRYAVMGLNRAKLPPNALPPVYDPYAFGGDANGWMG